MSPSLFRHCPIHENTISSPIMTFAHPFTWEVSDPGFRKSDVRGVHACSWSFSLMKAIVFSAGTTPIVRISPRHHSPSWEQCSLRLEARSRPKPMTTPGWIEWSRDYCRREQSPKQPSRLAASNACSASNSLSASVRRRHATCTAVGSMMERLTRVTPPIPVTCLLYAWMTESLRYVSKASKSRSRCSSECRSRMQNVAIRQSIVLRTV